MAEPFTISGSRGLVKHLYQTAVEVSAFVVRRDPSTNQCTVTGVVVTSDAYLLTQRPLIFVVPKLAAAGARWPVDSVTITNGHLVAQLGPRFERE